jgi:hypothetical protein
MTEPGISERLNSVLLVISLDDKRRGYISNASVDKERIPKVSTWVDDFNVIKNPIVCFARGSECCIHTIIEYSLRF